jgi:pyruvate dehydrogenase E2 component (dihydrolipoamide acetyltransferase)
MKIVRMPKAGQTVEEAKILRWFYQEGETVEKGAPLMEVETDKAAIELEAPAGGVLRRLLHAEGETVPVLKPVAVIGSADEDVSDAAVAAAAAADAPAAEAVPTESSAPDNEPEPVKTATVDAAAAEKTAPVAAQRLFASPAARRVAKESGLDLAAIRGSGALGRILQADVRAAVHSAALPGERRLLSPLRRTNKAVAGQTVPLTKMRRVIGQKLAEAKREIPHFYCRMEMDAGPLMLAARAAKAAFGGSLNDILAHTVVETLKEFPEVNARFLGDKIECVKQINLGMAVAVEEGLLVPVVADAGCLSVEGLAKEIRRAVQAARAGKSPGAGTGTFTITNLGMFGLDEFAAVINPPEVAILAVGAVKEKVWARNGGLFAGYGLTVTLSADHRALDGAAAAVFLARLKERMEAL